MSEHSRQTITYPLTFDASGKALMDRDDYASKVKVLIDFAVYQKIRNNNFGTLLGRMEQEPVSNPGMVSAHMMHLRDSISENIPGITVFSIEFEKPTPGSPRKTTLNLLISVPNESSLQEIKAELPITAMF